MLPVYRSICVDRHPAYVVLCTYAPARCSTQNMLSNSRRWYPAHPNLGAFDSFALIPDTPLIQGLG